MPLMSGQRASCALKGTCMLAILLCCTAAPITAARFLLQSPSASPPAAPSANGAHLRPAATSQVFTAEGFANNGNFTLMPGYTTNVTGDLGQLGYNIQLVNRTTGSNLSAWHDVPLELQVGSDGSVTLNTMVEIPAGEQAKYETVTMKPGNPIQQDTNDLLDAQGNITGEVPRYYLYGPSLGNYGGLPETWSNSNKTDPVTGYPGDNDPLDVLDISSIRAPIGAIYRVKLLGVLGMIDANETDWKVMVIDANDPQAATYNNILDVPKERLEAILQFYANYKQAEGKPKACFWPVNSTATGPVCEVPADADPAKFFHPRDSALQVIKRYQDNYAWLLAGNCKSDACADLWWPEKTTTASAGDSKAAAAPASG